MSTSHFADDTFFMNEVRTYLKQTNKPYKRRFYNAAVLENKIILLLFLLDSVL